MKGIIQAALAATLVASVTAQPHAAHQHRHHHEKKHFHDALQKRDPVTVTSVVAATVTEYVLDGQVLDGSKAQDGIKDGNFIVVGSSTPTFIPPPPPSSTSSTSATSSSTQAAQFFEHKSSTSAPPAAAPTPVATGIDAPFPTGDDAPSCDVFPSKWGALAVDWVGTGGWTSLQVPDAYIPGVKINTIVAPISGGCRPGAFCSHACPPGYQKTQWPEEQGASGQSVGGLYCDSNNKLRLTRPSKKTLCEKGAGGVFIKNNLSGSAAVCRTDYPASENMVVPLLTTPGGTFELTNPDQTDYYMWEGKPTSAQYYLNPKNVALEDACVWVSSTNPSSAGNWAPIIIGTGKASDGITYLSIFPNTPTSTAPLDFNVRITGDVTIECKYENGAFVGNSAGCTTGLSTGTAYIEFYD